MKLIGNVPVGSAWPPACSIVTVAPVVSTVTLLSVLVEALLNTPSKSLAALARTAACNNSVAGHIAHRHVIGSPAAA